MRDYTLVAGWFAEYDSLVEPRWNRGLTEREERLLKQARVSSK